MSIVIVNYNSGPYLRECIESINRSLTIGYEVVIVDNRSDDGSLNFISSLPASCPVRVVNPGANVGFGAGCNLGADMSQGDWLHFLNPDTVVDDALDREYQGLTQAEDNRSIYVTQLADAEGKVVKSGFVLPTLANYFLALVGNRRVGRWYRGASVIMSRGTYKLLGGWSTYTLAYAEDVDLFFKAQRLGIKVEEWGVPVTHFGEGCTQNFWNAIERRIRVERATRAFYRQNGIFWQYYPIALLQVIRNLLLLRSDAILQGRAIIGAWRRA
jgi:GT2 family glycosyltransferase